MNSIASTLLLWAMAAAVLAGNGPIYRCVQGGKVTFTDEPANATCQPLDLKVYQPDPAEVARLEEQKRKDAEQERLDREQAEKDRLIQAQTRAALAQAREANSQTTLNQLGYGSPMGAGMDGGYGYSYSTWPNFYNPGVLPSAALPLPAPLPYYNPNWQSSGGYNPQQRPWGFNPPLRPPVYPYGVDRVGPAGP